MLFRSPPSPAGGSIVAIAARGNEGWALTRDGVVIAASADGLRARRAHPYDPTQTVGTVAVLSPAAVWIAFPGALLRWDGARFERAEFFDGMSEPTRVWSGGPDDLWLAGPVGTVLHFDGRRWSDRSIAAGAEVVALSGGAGEGWAQTADEIGRAHV